MLHGFLRISILEVSKLLFLLKKCYFIGYFYYVSYENQGNEKGDTIFLDIDM